MFYYTFLMDTILILHVKLFSYILVSFRFLMKHNYIHIMSFTILSNSAGIFRNVPDTLFQINAAISRGKVEKQTEEFHHN
jgi:hypothetical protein